MEDSKNQRVRAKSRSIFRQSIKAAVINQMDEALVQIERFILDTSELFAQEVSETANIQRKIKAGNELRFALHVLFLMVRAKARVDEKFLGRALALYAQV